MQTIAAQIMVAWTEGWRWEEAAEARDGQAGSSRERPAACCWCSCWCRGMSRAAMRRSRASYAGRALGARLCCYCMRRSQYPCCVAAGRRRTCRSRSRRCVRRCDGVCRPCRYVVECKRSRHVRRQRRQHVARDQVRRKIGQIWEYLVALRGGAARKGARM